MTIGTKVKISGGNPKEIFEIIAFESGFLVRLRNILTSEQVVKRNGELYEVVFGNL